MNWLLRLTLVARIIAGPGAEPKLATWYGPGFYNSRTASGAVYDRSAIWVASADYPLGAWVKVTVLEDCHGRRMLGTITLEVKDTMPEHGRIDLTAAAAQSLGIKDAGCVYVAVEQKP